MVFVLHQSDLAEASLAHLTIAPFTKYLVGILAVCTLFGCNSYRAEGSRTVGEFTDDVGISSRVKTALLRDEEVKGLRIDVDVRRSVVSLYGRVPSTYARNKAVNIAKGVRGVREVKDKLTLVDE